MAAEDCPGQPTGLCLDERNFLLYKYPHSILIFASWSPKHKICTFWTFTTSGLDDISDFIQLHISNAGGAEKEAKIILAWLPSLFSCASGRAFSSFWMGWALLTFSSSWNARIASWTRVSIESIWIGKSKIQKTILLITFHLRNWHRCPSELASSCNSVFRAS